MSPNRIKELALLILSKTTDIDEKLNSRDLLTPSFKPESSKSLLHDEISEPRQAVLEATDELHALMLGPIGLLTSHSHEISITLQAIHRFGLATSFPDGKDEATFEEISQLSGLCATHVQRILRHAITHRIFCEPQKGVVAHTAASKHLAMNPLMHEWIGMVYEEMWPAASKTVEAMTRWPNSDQPNHSGFNITHETDKTVLEELAKYPDRQARYAAAMTWFSTGPGLESTHVVDGFPWEIFQNGIVVDVGGSYGAISMAIAKRFSTLRFIIQDQATVIQKGRISLPAEFHGRISFMEHDFFKEQPVTSADVYLLRWILHDWPDAYAIKILKALVPALKNDSRICICELVLPEPGLLNSYHARSLRSMDLAMLEFHNAKERDEYNWADLLHRADQRFHIVDIKQPQNSRLSMIEVRWQLDRAEVSESLGRV